MWSRIRGFVARWTPWPMAGRAVARPLVVLLVLAGCRAGPAGEPAPSGGPPAEAPAVWQGLVGEYSDGRDTLSVLEDRGSLQLLTWRKGRQGLRTTSDSALALEHGGQALVRRASDRRATALVLRGRQFSRLAFGPEDGTSFRITPERDVATLRREAAAATPPVESGDFRPPELVELTSLDPALRLDIRYATTNNFMGSRFYSSPRAFLQRPAAEALARAHRWLRTQGYGLLIHDGYRPWYVTWMFWESTPEPLRIFVANPATGSRHNRGCAVDLTLYDLATGQPAEMTGGYDEMSPRSFPDYAGGTSRQRWLRDLLRRAMEAEGFTVYEAEWWHFDYRDWRRYRIGNQTFEELSDGR
jgi:D-alanyl-D-alanine dipeptidase